MRTAAVQQMQRRCLLLAMCLVHGTNDCIAQGIRWWIVEPHGIEMAYCNEG